MRPRSIGTLIAIAILVLSATAVEAHPRSRWSVGINFGGPGYYRPYYGYYDPWPRPVYVVPQPVYVAPAPVIVPSYSAPAAPQPENAPLPPPRRLEEAPPDSVAHYVAFLTNTDERVRLETVTQLGRTKSPRAVDSLAATLAGDSSPQVREAAAKALGLIGSPAAMPALKRALQMDSSHDVRRTAQFAIEIIQSK